MLLASAVGFVWIGVAFFSYGLFVVFMPITGEAGAAFLSALACAAFAGAASLPLLLRQPSQTLQREPIGTPVVHGGALIKALSELTQDHPLMAVCCAALLGATNGADDLKLRR